MCYYENKKIFNLIALSCAIGVICSVPVSAKENKSSQYININSNAINYDYSKEKESKNKNDDFEL